MLVKEKEIERETEREREGRERIGRKEGATESREDMGSRVILKMQMLWS